MTEHQSDPTTPPPTPPPPPPHSSLPPRSSAPSDAAKSGAGFTKIFFGFAAIVGVSTAVVLLVLRGGSKAVEEMKQGAASGPVVVIDDGSSPAGSDPLRPDRRVEELKLGDFTLLDSEGKTVTQEVFKGKLTLVSFFFTRCTTICPALTGRTLQLCDELKDTPVRFLTISVDGDHDTPEVIKAYAKDVNADSSRWTLATAPRERVWGILRNGLKWGIEDRTPERPAPGSETVIMDIRHPGWYALVGPDGRVLDLYQSGYDEAIEKLKERVRAASKAMAARASRG